MTKYNQVHVGNNVLTEITDQNIYFEYNTTITQPFALTLTHTEFETLYNNPTPTLTHTTDLTTHKTPTYTHIISDVLTITFPTPNLNKLHEYYTTIKPDLQDPSRHILLIHHPNNHTELAYASQNALKTTKTKLKQKHPNATITTQPLTEYQSQ